MRILPTLVLLALSTVLVAQDISHALSSEDQDSAPKPTVQSETSQARTAELAPVKTTIDVFATEAEVAEAQVKEAEKQRVLGFVPNFYTSYIPDAAPMTPKLKFHLAFRSSIDPVTFIAAAGIAGVEQKRNTFPGYGHGGEAYLKRFGAAYADSLTSRMLGAQFSPPSFTRTLDITIKAPEP